jgi:hypothetical protein
MATDSQRRRAIRRINAVDAPSSNWYSSMPQEQVLKVYPQQYRDCRVSGHAWPRPEDPIGLITWKWVGVGQRDRTVECMRCGYRKTEHFNKKAERIGSTTPRYPRGYLTPGTGLNIVDFREVAHEDELRRAEAAGRVFGAEEDFLDQN